MWSRISVCLTLGQAALIIRCLLFWLQACLSLPTAYTVDGKVLARGPPLTLFFFSFLWNVYMWRLPHGHCAGSAPHSLTSVPWAWRPPGGWAREQEVRGYNQGKRLWLCVCVCAPVCGCSFFCFFFTVRLHTLYLTISFIFACVKHYVLYDLHQ